MKSFWAAVEAKVKAASIATLIVSGGVAVLNWVVGDSTLLGALPPWSQAVLVTFGPAVASFAAGYKARHTAKAPVPTK